MSEVELCLAAFGGALLLSGLVGWCAVRRFLAAAERTALSVSLMFPPPEEHREEPEGEEE